METPDLTQAGSLELQQKESPSLGIALDAATPVRWLEVRASVDRTVGAELTRGPWEFDEDCGCQQLRRDLGGTPVGDVAVWSVFADAIVKPFSASWDVRPYFVAGVGGKHYRFDRDDFDDNGQPGIDPHEWDRAVNFGMGFEVGEKAWTIRIEATNRFAHLIRRGPFGSHDVIHNDLLITTGVRLPLW